MSLKFRFKIIYPFKHQVLYNNNRKKIQKEVTQILNRNTINFILYRGCYRLYKETKEYIYICCIIHSLLCNTTQQERILFIHHSTQRIKYLMPYIYLYSLSVSKLNSYMPFVTKRYYSIRIYT